MKRPIHLFGLLYITDPAQSSVEGLLPAEDELASPRGGAHQDRMYVQHAKLKFAARTWRPFVVDLARRGAGLSFFTTKSC